jgi:hypothetical protein
MLHAAAMKKARMHLFKDFNYIDKKSKNIDDTDCHIAACRKFIPAW